MIITKTTQKEAERQLKRLIFELSRIERLSPEAISFKLNIPEPEVLKIMEELQHGKAKQ